MSETVIRPYHVMSVAVVAYHRSMVRWEPNARSRLEQAALRLKRELGLPFEKTFETVPTSWSSPFVTTGFVDA